MTVLPSAIPSRILRLLAAALLLCHLAHRAAADIVYVASFTTGEIVRYDSASPAATRTVLSGSGSFVRPGGLVYGPDGHLYVGEGGNGLIAPRVSRFDLATLTRSTVYEFAEFELFPGSLAFKGSDLLVGRNPFFGDAGPIVRIANATGGVAAASTYTTSGTLASSPGLALAPDGTLYVSDQTYDFVSRIATGPVKRFDAAGNYLGEVIGSGSNGLAGPTGLVLSGSTLFTASIMAGTILQTNLLTDVTQPFASVGAAFEVGVLARLADGSLLAGSPSGSGAIYRFGSDGTLVGSFASGLGQVGGIAVAPVPEPSAVVLGAMGVVCAVGWLRRRRITCPR